MYETRGLKGRETRGRGHQHAEPAIFPSYSHLGPRPSVSANKAQQEKTDNVGYDPSNIVQHGGRVWVLWALYDTVSLFNSYLSYLSYNLRWWQLEDRRDFNSLNLHVVEDLVTTMASMTASSTPYWPLSHVKGDVEPGKPIDLTPSTALPLEVENYEVAEPDDDEKGENKAPSLFLSLPLEIRLEIFKHLLTLPSSAPAPSRNTYYQPTPHPPASHLHPAILRASRQLHAEALPLLYRRNTFLTHNTLLTTLPRLRRAYGPVLSGRLARLITRFYVCVRLDAEPGYDRAQAAAQLSGKEEIILDAWQAGMWTFVSPLLPPYLFPIERPLPLRRCRET
ncbi:hypothetical protein F5Y11DRAFT_212650 [Daldinia sp. FL1419]|nr:hypothetical protein F5Y11DRAFT_212650 [Daldinia sp. FL1419]